MLFMENKMKYLPIALLACLLAAPSLHAQTLDETRANLHSAYDGLMKSLAEQETLAKDIEKLNAEITQQRKTLEPDTQRVADLRAKVDAAKAANSPELQTAEMRLKVAEIEYRGLSESLTAQENTLAEATARMKTLEAGTQSDIQKVQQLRQQVATLSEKEKSSSVRREAARAAELEQLKDELITLKISLQETQGEKDILATRANALQTELETLQSQPCGTTGAPGVVGAAAGAAASTASTATASNAAISTAAASAPAVAETRDAPAATGDLAAELAARLQARNIEKATRKSGRYLYVKTVTADGKTHSQAFPWLSVDRDYYTLEADMKAGETTLTFGNQRQTLEIPAADDGATYVFVLEDATKDDAKLGYYKK